jgi:hypothetical protein
MGLMKHQQRLRRPLLMLDRAVAETSLHPEGHAHHSGDVLVDRAGVVAAAVAGFGGVGAVIWKMPVSTLVIAPTRAPASLAMARARLRASLVALASMSTRFSASSV